MSRNLFLCNICLCFQQLTRRFEHLDLCKYSCSSAISTLEGIENKQRLQTLSIDNAWSNKNFLFYRKFLLDHALSMDNVCNRCLFSSPSIYVISIFFLSGKGAGGGGGGNL